MFKAKRTFLNRVIMVISIVFVTYSCSNPVSDKTAFSIQGKLTNCKGEKILLQEMDINRIVQVDSAEVDPSGMFYFERETDQEGFYFLRFPGGRKILLLIGKNERLSIKGDCLGDSDDFELDGSPGSLILSGFFNATNQNKRQVDSLQILVKKNEGSVDFPDFMNEVDLTFQKIALSQKNMEIEFLQKNPNSLASLIILNYSFGGKPFLDIEKDFYRYQWLDSCLQKSHPGNKHVDFHHKRIVEYQRQQSIKTPKKNIGKNE